MARKSIEESIREVPTSELEYRLEHDRKAYSADVLTIMNDELIQRSIKQANPIDQVKIVKKLSNDEIEYIVTQSKHNYPEALYKIILNEYNSRDLEKEQWFYLSNTNETLGPVNFSDLKKFAEDDIIGKETLIVKEGFTDWVSAIDIAGLFDNESNLIQTATNQNETKNQPYRKPLYNHNYEDNLGCGLSILSFLVPIIGAILFVAYPGHKGRTAGQLALFGFFVNIFLTIYFFY